MLRVCKNLDDLWKAPGLPQTICNFKDPEKGQPLSNLKGFKVFKAFQNLQDLKDLKRL